MCSFIGDKLSGVIDFYFACNDALAYDLAICLNAWCFEPDGSFNVTKGRALLARLPEPAPADAERATALPMLARGAALRFLLTRSTTGSTCRPARWCGRKTRCEYLDKLRFHQTIDQRRANTGSTR